MRKSTIPLLLAAVAMSWTADAAGNKGSSDASPSPIVNAAPKHERMIISNETPDPKLLIRDGDLLKPCFQDEDPEIPFPLRAQLDKIYAGRAVVGVMLSADGTPTDFLAIQYSRPVFAEEMIKDIRHASYSPRRFHGDGVPGRFSLAKAFSVNDTNSVDPNQAATVTMNGLEESEALSNRVGEGRNGPKLVYWAHHENELDGHLLKMTSVVLPEIPADCKITQPGRNLKVIVSFYVDEAGNVRLPNIDSDTPVDLAASVLHAMAQWKFERPLIKKKPVLVFADRTLIFAPEAAPAAASPAAAKAH